MARVPKLVFEPRPDPDAVRVNAKSAKPVALPPPPRESGTCDAQRDGYDSRSAAGFGSNGAVFRSMEVCERQRRLGNVTSSKPYSMPRPPALDGSTEIPLKQCSRRLHEQESRLQDSRRPGFAQTSMERPDATADSQMAECVRDATFNRGRAAQPMVSPFQNVHRPVESDKTSQIRETRRILPTPPPRQGFLSDSGDAVTHHVEALLAKQAHAMSEKLRADIHDARLRAEVKKVRIQQELQQALHSVAAARSSSPHRSRSEPPLPREVLQACLLSSPFMSAVQAGPTSSPSPLRRQAERRTVSVERFPSTNSRALSNSGVAPSVEFRHKRPAESFLAGRLLLPPPPLLDLSSAEPVPRPRSPAPRSQPLSWHGVRAAALARRAASTDARPWAGRSPPVPGELSFARTAAPRWRSPPDLACRTATRSPCLSDSSPKRAARLAFDSTGHGALSPPCALLGMPQHRTDVSIGRGEGDADQLTKNAAQLMRERNQTAETVHRRLANMEVECDGFSRDYEKFTSEDQELLRLVGKLRVMVAAKKDDFFRARLPPPPQCAVGPQRSGGVAQLAQDSRSHFPRAKVSASSVEESMHPKEVEGHVQLEPSPQLPNGEPEAEKSLDESPLFAVVNTEHTVASRCLRANSDGASSTSETSGSFTGSFAQAGAFSRSASFSSPPPECLRRIVLPAPPSSHLLDAQGPRTPEFRAPREARADGIADKVSVPRSTGRLPMVPLLFLGKARSSAETLGAGHER